MLLVYYMKSIYFDLHKEHHFDHRNVLIYAVNSETNSKEFEQSNKQDHSILVDKPVNSPLK